MMLKLQKRIAADILKVSPEKIHFDPAKLKEIKEAITRADIVNLIKTRAISKNPTSRSRLRIKNLKLQKKKGRRKGLGSRKGKKTARLKPKKTWMIKVRGQRKFVKLLHKKKVLNSKDYRVIYRRIKGGFFRSRRHLKLYLEEKKRT